MRPLHFFFAFLCALSWGGCQEPQPQPQAIELRRSAKVALGPESKAGTQPKSKASLRRLKSDDLSLGPFLPALPAKIEKTRGPHWQEKVALGRMLYFEKRLSKNHDVSCNSCHPLDKYGMDGEKTSPGHRGQRGPRNSPTVYNAAWHFKQFWDSRSPHVEDQATHPLTNPVEMGMPGEKEVVAVLRSMPGYQEAFQAAFPDAGEPISLVNTGKAIGAFERGLLTPSPWDNFLDGDDSALNDEEKEGFYVFRTTGCVQCHRGSLVGGHTNQRLGSVKAWPRQEDQGRFQVTQAGSDKMLFKVPSLRNVAKTAPYFHDGLTSTLEEAVQMMAHYQLGRELSEPDVQSIVAWLKTLTGRIPTEYIKEPKLPKSTSKTPQPNPL